MEEWRPAPGYESCYEVSNLGNCRNIRTGLVLAGRARKKRGGYIAFGLCKNGKVKDKLAHRLACEAFYGRIPDGYEINHINGIVDDNRLINLEICTRSKNLLHSYRHLGLRHHLNGRYGSKSNRTKLTEADIPKIRAFYQSGIRQKDIGAMFGVSQHAVSEVVRRKRWGYV